MSFPQIFHRSFLLEQIRGIHTAACAPMAMLSVYIAKKVYMCRYYTRRDHVYRSSYIST